jgi:hypothetical protein
VAPEGRPAHRAGRRAGGAACDAREREAARADGQPRAGFASRGCAYLAVALLALVLASCVKPASTPPPARSDIEVEIEQPTRTYEELAALVSEIKAFQRRIGYGDTKNFLRFADYKDSFPFCGFVSRLYLPYSYEDPAITWLETPTEQQCRKEAGDADVFYGSSEAIAEHETPVTTSMLAAPIDRVLYLVIHEDCHEQFEFPYGIEEPLCNLIAYRAMEAFSLERFGAESPEHPLVVQYARRGASDAHATLTLYNELASLYARHARSETSAEAVLRQREPIFRRAEQALGWSEGQVNNVVMANGMTYARHYPLMAEVYDALGRDLARTVAFFRKVDEMKPTEAQIMEKHGIVEERSLAFLRAYENAIVETIEKALAGARPR